MKLYSQWSDFENALLKTAANGIMEILQCAALKKKMEIENTEDVELSDIFVRNLLTTACRQKRSPQEQLRFIRHYHPDEIED